MEKIRSFSFLVCVALSAAIAPAYGQMTCELGGKEVNTANGADTAGKTGMLRCKEGGKIVREEEYKNGSHVGYEMMIDFEGKKTVRNVTEKHNSIGVLKVYNPKGVLVREENYGPGKQPGWSDQQGVTRHFTDEGKLEYIAWFEHGDRMFEAEYLKNGKVARLSCGKRSYFDGDRELCGFAGKPSKVQLFASSGEVYETRQYRNGKLQENAELDERGRVLKKEEYSGDAKKKTEFFPNGKIKIEAGYHDQVLQGDEKEYHSSGKLVRLTRWDGGKMVTEDTYYLNGQPKTKASRKKLKDKWCVARQEFWDDGKVRDEGIYEEKTEDYSWQGLYAHRWAYESPIGEHRLYFENGRPALIERYGEKGELAGTRQAFSEATGKLALEEKYENGTRKSRKEWGPDGKLTLDEEYLEDGSRVRHPVKKGSGI